MCPSKVVTWRREWGFRVSFRVAILTASHVCPELHHSSPIVCEDVCSDCQNCRIINVWLKALLLCVLTWICYLLSMRIEGIGDVAPVLFACLLYVANMTPGSCVYVFELGNSGVKHCLARSFFTGPTKMRARIYIKLSPPEVVRSSGWECSYEACGITTFDTGAWGKQNCIVHLLIIIFGAKYFGIASAVCHRKCNSADGCIYMNP
jgi:hypothetical protein